MLGFITEIRRRSMYVIACFCLLFLLFYFYSSELFIFILKPLLANINQYGNLVSTSVSGPIFAQIKLAFDLSIIAVFPYLFYQIWLFIYPALKKHESIHILRLFMYGILLFISGVSFAYFLVLPFIFKFLLSIAPKEVMMLPDINYTLDFVTRMLLVFGVCFQLPLITNTLVKMRLLTIKNLKNFRPYFIVFAFIIGMLFTPPDVFSQILLALPMILLYELSIFCSKSIN